MRNDNFLSTAHLPSPSHVFKQIPGKLKLKLHDKARRMCIKPL